MLEINKADFVNALKSLATMMPKKDVRYYLNGMYFEFNSDHLNMVTTNGHGLIVARLDLFMPEELIGKSLTVSVDAMETIMRGLKPARKRSNEEAVEAVVISMVGVGSDWTLTDSGVTYQLTELDGRFPDWKRVAYSVTEATEEIGVMTGYLNEVHKAFHHLRGASVNSKGKVEFHSYQTVSMRFSGASGVIHVKPGTLYSVKHLKSVELWLMPARV